MNPLAHEYEVRLKLVNPNTGEVREVKRTEMAYRPFDAYSQAVLMVASSLDAGSADITLVGIGPPKAAWAVTVDAGDLERKVAEAISSILRKGRIRDRIGGR